MIVQSSDVMVRLQGVFWDGTSADHCPQPTDNVIGRVEDTRVVVDWCLGFLEVSLILFPFTIKSHPAD